MTFKNLFAVSAFSLIFSGLSQFAVAKAYSAEDDKLFAELMNLKLSEFTKDTHSVERIVKHINRNLDAQELVNQIERNPYDAKADEARAKLVESGFNSVDEFLPDQEKNIERLAEPALHLAGLEALTGRAPSVKKTSTSKNFSKESYFQGHLTKALDEAEVALWDVAHNRPGTGYSSDHLQKSAANLLAQIQHARAAQPLDREFFKEEEFSNLRSEMMLKRSLSVKSLLKYFSKRKFSDSKD